MPSARNYVKYTPILIAIAWVVIVIINRYIFPSAFLIYNMKSATTAIAVSAASLLVSVFVVGVFAYIVSSDGDATLARLCTIAFLLLGPLGVFLVGNLRIDIFLHFEKMILGYLGILSISSIIAGWLGNKFGEKKINHSTS